MQSPSASEKDDIARWHSARESSAEAKAKRKGVSSRALTTVVKAAGGGGEGRVEEVSAIYSSIAVRTPGG